MVYRHISSAVLALTAAFFFVLPVAASEGRDVQMEYERSLTGFDWDKAEPHPALQSGLDKLEAGGPRADGAELIQWRYTRSGSVTLAERQSLEDADWEAISAKAGDRRVFEWARGDRHYREEQRYEADDDGQNGGWRTTHLSIELKPD